MGSLVQSDERTFFVSLKQYIMKVLFDYQTFYIQKMGGVSNSFANLVANFPEGLVVEIAVKESDNIHLCGKHITTHLRPCRMTKENFIMHGKFPLKHDLFKVFSALFPQKTSLGTNKQYAIEKLEEGDYDVFHPIFYDTYFLNHLHGKPFVLTVHDMIPELFFKKGDSQISRKRELVKCAAHIVAVSENTKRDVVEMLHVPEERITVIYHGAPDDVAYSKTSLFDFNYLLFVGHRAGYKSFQPMVRHLLPFLERHKDLKLVCTEAPFTAEELTFFRHLGLTDRLIHFHATDEQLLTLYHNAECFIFPSVYEGFGIPILEAYQCECPVVLNRKSCFPEIAADAAVYFDMDDTGSNLVEKLEHLFASPGERCQLIERQKRRLRDFSWKKAAEELAAVYEKVVRKEPFYC